jgi:heme A synthase
VNTQFLLAALVLTAWFSRDTAPPSARPQARVGAALLLAILVSVTGVIAALGDTLFPAGSLVEGFRQDLSTGANFLVRLRTAHPVLAILVAGYCAIIAVSVMRRQPRSMASQIALGVFMLSFAQLGAGAINLALLAPIGMQIAHLLLADLLWIALVLLTVEWSGFPSRATSATGR